MINKNNILGKKAKISYLQILILITSIFAFSYLIYSTSESVEAQSVGQVCCEETVDGHTCQYTDPNLCSPDFEKVPTICELTGFCEIGCCISPTTGLCNERTSRRDCEIMNGTFEANEFCNVKACEKGCCVLGSEALWTTEKNCEWEGNSENRDIPTDFRRDPDSDTHPECIFSVEKDKEGACVYDTEKGKKCIFTTLEDCVSRTGSEENFNHAGLYCSDPSLNTTCKAKNYKGCREGEEDVYWFDSCDNSEDVAEDCDFFQGNYCGKDNGKYICKDIDCIVDGKRRRNGESWCEYDGRIGDGLDPAGSRHVKHICYMGVERIEPCADYRNEICVQSDSVLDDGGTFSEAACRVNQWRTCLDMNTKKDKEGVEKVVQKCKKNPDCHVKHIDMGKGFNFKICLPNYPPGFNLESDYNLVEGVEVMNSAEGICSVATQRCTEIWICGIFGCVCKVNCDCHTAKFTRDMNDFCVSLGDCGAYINYVGRYTDGGYGIRSTGGAPPRLSEGALKAFANNANPHPNQKPADPGNFEFFQTLNPGLLQEVPEEGEYDVHSNLTAFEKELLGVSGAYGTPVLLKMLEEGSGEEDIQGAVESVSLGPVNYARYTNGAATTQSSISSQIIHEEVKKGDFEMIGALIAGMIAYLIFESIMIAFLAALLAFIFLISWIKKVHIDFSCYLWEPPVGGEDCNECNKLDVPCSEYRCQSLGQKCQFINKGTENELCVARPENTALPVINPLYSVISENYSYSDVSKNGFKIVDSRDNGCVEAYTSVRFGIKIEPFARCKWGTEILESYEEMPNYFGVKGNSLLPVHRNELFFPSPEAFKNQYNLTQEQIDELGQMKYYVKCKTADGKINPDNYIIETCVKPGPDLTPPRISPVSDPPNGAYLKYNQTEATVKFFVNEPSNCKWSIEDKKYEDMENLMVCDQSVEDYTNYGLQCNTTFTGLLNNTDFYLRCQDTSENKNTMTESYHYKLLPSVNPLEIVRIKPDDGEVIVAGFEPVNLTFRLETTGGAQTGISTCSWRFSVYSDRFRETESNTHSTPVMSVLRGAYNVTFTCEDIAENIAENSTSFVIQIDNEGPEIVRVYYDGGLKISTSEESECRYGFERKFDFDNATEMYDQNEGLDHYTSWYPRTYYIQCQDVFKNKGNKIKVKAYDLFF